MGRTQQGAFDYFYQTEVVPKLTELEYLKRKKLNLDKKIRILIIWKKECFKLPTVDEENLIFYFATIEKKDSLLQWKEKLKEESELKYDFIWTAHRIDCSHVSRKVCERGIFYVSLGFGVKDDEARWYSKQITNLDFYGGNNEDKNYPALKYEFRLNSYKDNDPDKLNRAAFVKQCMQIIHSVDDAKYAKWRNLSFAIDGKWGSGKTYVLDLLQEELKKEMWADRTPAEKNVVFYYNCWQYDYYEEPAIAIATFLADQLRQWYQTTLDVFWRTFGEEILKAANKLIHDASGIDLNKQYELLKSLYLNTQTVLEEQHDFDEFYSFRKAMEAIKYQLSRLSKKRKIIFIVDELDRCLPEYSIKVLERLHHIFDKIENSILILAVDQEQLTESIHQIYGDMTVEKYLKKFIDFSIRLDYGNMHETVLDRYAEFFKFFLEGEKKERIKESTANPSTVTTKEAVYHEIRKVFRLPPPKIIDNPEGIDRSASTEIRMQERLMRSVMMNHMLTHTLDEKESGEKIYREDTKGQVDASILLFEVIYSFTKMKIYEAGKEGIPYRDLEWMKVDYIASEENGGTGYRYSIKDPKLKEILGKDYHSYLVNLRKKCVDLELNTNHPAVHAVSGTSPVTSGSWDGKTGTFVLEGTYKNKVLLALDACLGARQNFSALPDEKENQAKINESCRAFVKMSSLFWE